MISLSLSNERSKKTNSPNFHAQPTAGMYDIAFFAYALQFPKTPTFSHSIHPTSQSISYVWFINSSTCSLPKYFFRTSSSQYTYSFEFDHQSAMNTISVVENKQPKTKMKINVGTQMMLTDWPNEQLEMDYH